MRSTLFTFTLLFMLGLAGLVLAGCASDTANMEMVTELLPTDEAVNNEAAPAEAEPAPLPETEVASVPAVRPTAVILTEDNRSPSLQSLTRSWNTDWTRRTIDYDEILAGGPPRDGIPPIDAPRFTTAVSAREWLADNEPVIALEINGDARAYPLQILTWHEIVNDTIGGEPVVVTFCPLCNSALVFDRRVGGQTFTFGTSGLLRNSDLIMYDRTTESLWQQFTGEGIVGELAGERLTFLPAAIVSFADFQTTYPEGQILTRDTGHNRNYGTNPYAGYDTIGQNPFLFEVDALDGRLPAMERVVTLGLGEDVHTAVAYPLSLLSQERVINDALDDNQPIVVLHQLGTASALGARIIAEADDVGATGVFSRLVEGQVLTFVYEADHGRVTDSETGSTWNIFGQATAGELAGTQLDRLVSGDHFWFSWAVFMPDTRIYGAE